ncbi:hypothetical protein AAY473_001420 [Plecturocebus cupreus]
MGFPLWVTRTFSLAALSIFSFISTLRTPLPHRAGPSRVQLCLFSVLSASNCCSPCGDGTSRARLKGHPVPYNPHREALRRPKESCWRPLLSEYFTPEEESQDPKPKKACCHLHNISTCPRKADICTLTSKTNQKRSALPVLLSTDSVTGHLEGGRFVPAASLHSKCAENGCSLQRCHASCSLDQRDQQRLVSVQPSAMRLTTLKPETPATLPAHQRWSQALCSPVVLDTLCPCSDRSLTTLEWAFFKHSHRKKKNCRDKLMWKELFISSDDKCAITILSAPTEYQVLFWELSYKEDTMIPAHNGLALLPSLECSAVISAHCSLCLLGSRHSSHFNTLNLNVLTFQMRMIMKSSSAKPLRCLTTLCSGNNAGFRARGTLDLTLGSASHQQLLSLSVFICKKKNIESVFMETIFLILEEFQEMMKSCPLSEEFLPTCGNQTELAKFPPPLNLSPKSSKPVVFQPTQLVGEKGGKSDQLEPETEEWLVWKTGI